MGIATSIFYKLYFMSKRNKEIIQQLFEALGNENLDLLKTYLADDAKWNIIGQPTLNGKEEIIKVMQQGLNSEKLVTLVKLMSEGDEVRVESINQSKERLYRAYYCEIYTLQNERIKEITCYRVTTPISKD